MLRCCRAAVLWLTAAPQHRSTAAPILFGQNPSNNPPTPWGEDIFFSSCIPCTPGRRSRGWSSPPERGGRYGPWSAGRGRIFLRSNGRSRGPGAAATSGFCAKPWPFPFLSRIPLSLTWMMKGSDMLSPQERLGLSRFFFAPMIKSWPLPESFPERDRGRPKRRVEIPPA